MPIKLSALYKNTCSNISSIQLSSLYLFKAENCSHCLGQMVMGLAGSVRSTVFNKKYCKILNYFDIFAALNCVSGIMASQLGAVAKGFCNRKIRKPLSFS